MPTPSSRLASIASSTTTNTFTTGSFSPTGGALLLVSGNVLATGGGLTISSVTDTFSGTGSWTIVQLRATDFQDNTGFIAYATLGSTPGSGTVTVNTSVNSIRTTVDVYEATGQDATTPVVQSKTGSGTADTLSLTLDSTPAADSLVFAAVATRSSSDPDITPGSNFTELGEISSGGTFAQANIECQYDAASATTTVDWSTLPTITNVGVAIEIAAAAGGGESLAPIISKIKQQRATYLRM